MTQIIKLPPTMFAAPGSPEAAAAIQRVKAELATQALDPKLRKGYSVTIVKERGI